MELKQIVALIIGLIILVGTVVYLIINQRAKVIEWLKFAVLEAEKMLGEKTGQLKLRLVYDWFCEKFSIIATIVPFKVFSAWVDVALQTMKEWLEVGNKIGDYIKEDNHGSIHE